MDTEVRLARVEVEVDTSKDAINKLSRAVDELRAAMDRGFAEVRASQAEQRAATERAMTELRREMNTNFRWLYGLVVTNMTFTFGIILHLAGVV